MIKPSSFFFTISIVFALLYSCNTTVNKGQINIKTNTVLAISKAHGSSGYEQYKKWVKHLDSSIIIYDLYDLSLDSAAKIISISDGLLISGGPDVNPNLYGEDSMSYICQTPDNYRDSLEYQSIKIAYSRQIPILGICRGQQIINVYFGGSLINDIPSQHGSLVLHRSDSGKCYHNISIINNTKLYTIANTNIVEVNSSHHQAVKVLGNNLIANAYANDSIIEAISLKKEINYPTFFLGVQFHPEHMISSAISDSIGNSFINALNSNK